MPNLLEKNQRQFTTQQANESRLCTKTRWVVEATNSILKQKFRALDSTVQNKQLPHYLDDFKIAGALINKYCSRLKSDKSNSETIARRMYDNRNKPNELQDIVEKYGLHRKSQFITIADQAQLDDFPKLSLETLTCDITYGSFQLKLGKTKLTVDYYKMKISFNIVSFDSLKLLSF